MRLLLAGGDTTVMALWLAHGQVTTTTVYVHTDMQSAVARAVE